MVHIWQCKCHSNSEIFSTYLLYKCAAQSE